MPYQHTLPRRGHHPALVQAIQHARATGSLGPAARHFPDLLTPQELARFGLGTSAPTVSPQTPAPSPPTATPPLAANFDCSMKITPPLPDERDFVIS